MDDYTGLIKILKIFACVKIKIKVHIEYVKENKIVSILLLYKIDILAICMTSYSCVLFKSL